MRSRSVIISINDLVSECSTGTEFILTPHKINGCLMIEGVFNSLIIDSEFLNTSYTLLAD